jgi:hypothetical protein
LTRPRLVNRVPMRGHAPLRSATTSGFDVYILEAECALGYTVNQGNINIADIGVALSADRPFLQRGGSLSACAVSHD